VSGVRADTPTAVVVAGDETTRNLLQGLLRLHNFWVEGEAAGEAEALVLVSAHLPTLLLLDDRLSDGRWPDLVRRSRGVVAGLRAILIAPAAHPPSIPDDPAERPDAILLRPFRFGEFADALVPADRPGPPRPS